MENDAEVVLLGIENSRVVLKACMSSLLYLDRYEVVYMRCLEPRPILAYMTCLEPGNLSLSPDGPRLLNLIAIV